MSTPPVYENKRNTSRGNLAEEQWNNITTLLPNDLCEIQSRLLKMQFQATNVPHSQNEPPLDRYFKAVVSLHDAANMACWAHFALQEAHAHLEWHCDKGAEMAGIQMAKFYVDNVPLRLYPAAEDAAESIIYFLKIDQDNFSNSDNVSVSSTAARVGLHLKDKIPKHDITRILKRLHRNKNWKKAMEYRNTWVHEQPPLCEGMGIVYKRKDRWQACSDLSLKSGRKVMSMGFGGGDECDWTIEDLMSTMRSALYEFSTLLEELQQIFQLEMEQKGFSFNLN